MASAFPQMVQDIRAELWDLENPPAGEEEAVAYVSMVDRVFEAQAVADVASAFAIAEVNRRDIKGLGIYGPNLVHSVGRQLGRHIKTDDQIVQSVIAIMLALAHGYVLFMIAEPARGLVADPEVEPEHVWRVAVQNFRGDGLGKAGVKGPLVSQMEERATDALLVGLREAGVLGWRTPTRLRQLGRYYAHAGALMRIAQTNWDLGLEAALYADVLGTEHYSWSEYRVDGDDGSAVSS